MSLHKARGELFLSAHQLNKPDLKTKAARSVSSFKQVTRKFLHFLVDYKLDSILLYPMPVWTMT